MSKITSVDEYIKEFPVEIQERLKMLRKMVHELAPNAEERISYNMPGFYLNGPLVYFAAFKNHIGLYPMPSAIEEFSEELSNYKHAKGSIQFVNKEDLPIELIKRIIEFRINENIEATSK